ncbi:flagellar protein FliT [Ornithinibacillus sp. L9]|uniref:Flagellar protein FliT n=1 Tax=Ornithinibacillus caprae TaxID=2678566 RepID=A0A6N8FPD0_9BACI|nr:flagellar protein FliT [Ornithinibacillus caprae]MUK90796.1 flagellar protein FliT [Ornithinibacillus caprae]
MNRLEEIHEITVRLKGLLDQDINAKNRPAAIEEITQLVEERGNYMKQVSPPFTSEEKRIGEKLVELNEELEAKMQRVFNDLKLEMKQSKKQKKSNHSYINPYHKVQTVDGLFMDRKK